MKPSARKNLDHVFNVFHQLNLKDAMSYVAEVRFICCIRLLLFCSSKCILFKWKKTNKIHCWSLTVGKRSPLVSVLQGERRGSLEFIRNDTAFIDFKKKFVDDFADVMPDIMADMSDDYGAMSPMR